MDAQTTNPEPQDALVIGRRAAEELAEALTLAGLKLPSLNGSYPVMGRPHVELGGASADAVFALARWIKERV
ncbi:hypothetical protein ACQEU8_18355 [Streptomyces sp. CA-250714]|uniref:hypothetical protein n=1 Tax=Streptomyces sp. CA-250714 TaxID=3240060 RepID=UPI003D94542A